MAKPKRLNNQCNRCRRAGEKLLLKGEKCLSIKCPLNRRSYPPGQHGGGKRRTHLTGYGEQLKEKQKAKRIYGLREHGYEPGTAREVLARILGKHGPLEAQKIIQLVQKERFLRENTILLNLQNKKYFEKLPDNRYTLIKEA